MHMIPRIDRGRFRSLFDKADERVGSVPSGKYAAVPPNVAAGEVQEFEILTGKMVLEDFDKFTTNAVVVVEACGDQMSKITATFFNGRLDGGLGEIALN